MSARGIAIVLLALFQVFGSVAIQAADLRLEVEELGAQVHIEDQSGEACGEPHHHLICQTARSLSTALGSSASRSVDGRIATAVTPTPHRTDGPSHTRIHLGSRGSRAPPLA